MPAGRRVSEPYDGSSPSSQDESQPRGPGPCRTPERVFQGQGSGSEEDRRPLCLPFLAASFRLGRVQEKVFARRFLLTTL